MNGRSRPGHGIRAVGGEAEESRKQDTGDVGECWALAPSLTHSTPQWTSGISLTPIWDALDPGTSLKV
jgi:hypothetical protein